MVICVSYEIFYRDLIETFLTIFEFALIYTQEAVASFVSYPS